MEKSSRSSCEVRNKRTAVKEAIKFFFLVCGGSFEPRWQLIAASKSWPATPAHSDERLRGRRTRQTSRTQRRNIAAEEELDQKVPMSLVHLATLLKKLSLAFRCRFQIHLNNCSVKKRKKELRRMKHVDAVPLG